MKATPGQQQLLLKVSELEGELRRAKIALAELQSGSALRELRDEQRLSSEAMLAAQSRYENFEVDIARILTDIELVDGRIQRDLDRLATSTVPKDIAGVQSELEALNARKEILETAELELLEARDAAGFEVSEAKALRTELSERISSIEISARAEIGKLQSSVSIGEEQLRATRLSVPDGLLAAFDRKASRGFAIGRLVDRDCGACRIALTSAVFSDISASPDDELATCPNCEAFLVR